MRVLAVSVAALMLLFSTSGESRARIEIYIVDAQDHPGVIRLFKEHCYGAESLGPCFQPVFFRSSGSVQAVALSPSWIPCFVDSRFLLSCAKHGTTSLRIYTHGRNVIRDLGFDSEGKLYFTEASGADSDGYLYRLHRWRQGPLGAVAARIMTVSIAKLGGSWNGDFAFDPQNRLFVSTGNRSPGSIFEYVNGQFRKRFTHSGPIMGFAFLDPHTVYFTNGGPRLYRLQDFETVSVVHESSEVTSLKDVAVARVPERGPCSISGLMHDNGQRELAEQFLRQLYVIALGPNVKWRGGYTVKCSPDDWRYALRDLPEGQYYVGTDFKGADSPHGFCAARETSVPGVYPQGKDDPCPHGYLVFCRANIEGVNFGFDGPPF